MSKALSIFRDQNTAMRKRGLSELTKTISTGITTRRIQTNTNGTFRRLVNGEQIGKAIRGEFNAIIVAMLPEVGRTFYDGTYDPDAKPTLPDCWSNDGRVPEESAPNKQASACVKCPNNIVGSGENGKGKACRYQRKIALLLEGDSSGDVYQMNIPAKSLFGKGSGNTHPYESYVRFLVANEVGIDYVVTNIAYNLDADTMELQFTSIRETTEDEEELVIAAQTDPNTQKLIRLTAGGADGATTASNGAAQQKAAVVEDDDEEDEAPAPAPKKRAAKPKPAPVVEDDADEDDGIEDAVVEEVVDEAVEETPPPAPKRRARKPKPEPEVVAAATTADTDADDDEQDEVMVAPVKRAAAKKPTPAPTSSKAKPDLLAILDKWSEEANDDADDETE